MGFSDLPEQTDAEKILSALDALSSRFDSFATALNGMGANQQWLVDNVKGIFEMFGSPAFMSQMMGAMGNAGFGPGPAADAGPAESAVPFDAAGA